MAMGRKIVHRSERKKERKKERKFWWINDLILVLCCVAVPV
jgi:hypothetical protein